MEEWMDIELIEHLASKGVRRLSSEDLAVELDFARRERTLTKNPEYKEYQTRRIAALLREQDRRRIMKEKPKPNAVTVEFIQDLKRRVDIRDIFNNVLGILVKPNGTKREYYSCPAHPDKHPSGVIYVEEQQYHCFQCQAHGDVYDALMAFKGMTFMQAVDEVAAYLGAERPKASQGFER
jgi:hypothetical protein